ncbi:MAG: GDSL-type esterase/lipase family protein [Muribaculaceae bacterium]|nr:GDSL-type esterase/lipase family protein [Muribaculaceae bacterium]
MKRCVLASILALSAFSVMAADTYSYNEYYYQRKSLFEQLPVDSNDIVFVGNSLTNGGDWHEIFNSEKVKNRGISSDVIQGISDRIDLVVSGKPKKIFLLAGVNDISHKIDADSIATAIEKLVIKIKESTPETTLYLQSLLPINNDFKRYRNLIGTEAVFPKANILLEKIAQKHGIIWIDLFPAFSDAEGKMNSKFTSDGLHLNADGYKVWRQNVAKYVEQPYSETGDLYSVTNEDIVMVGNSLIYGCEWHELLRNKNIKKRVTGSDLVTYLPQLASTVSKNNPKKIFLLSTYDDLTGKMNADSIVKRIEKSIKIIKATSPSTQIYLQGLIPLNSNYEKYSWFKGRSGEVVLINERLRNLAKKNGAKWINLYPIFVDDNGELSEKLTNDGFHLMGSAYNKWKEEILKYFK